MPYTARTISARRCAWLAGGCAAALGLGAAPMATAQTAPAAPPPSGQGEAARGLEEVVVTASRRETSVREIPTSISAYGGARLTDAHVETITDLAGGTPNVQVGAYSTNANITIRGIGDDLTTAGSDPGVAFHVNGVYLAQTGLTANTLLDVARVEVLRGPQGTLFGRNATGGAINIINNAPTASLHYGGEVSAGVDPTEDHVSGYVSGPLSSDGTLLGRIAVQQTYNEGFSKNLADAGPRRLDDQDNYSTLVQLAWRPTATFDARLLVDAEHENDHGPAVYLLGSPQGGALPSEIAGQPTGDINARETYASLGQRRLDAEGATLITNWSIGGGALKSTVAVNATSQITNADDDGTAVAFSNTYYHQIANQYFVESVYTSNPDRPLTYVVGANYFHEHEFQRIDVPISFIPVPVELISAITTDSIAAFAHAQYAFHNGVKLFGGVRVTDDRKSIAESNNFIGADAQHASWLRPTFEVGASYDISRLVTGYVKYATGYKGGGYSGGSLTPAFNPETDRLVEVGLKGTYLDGHLQANLSAFHTDYTDLQVAQTIGVNSRVTNAAAATVDGVEFETVERITRDLRLELSGGWLNARFDRFDTTDSARPQLGVLNLAGNLLPQAPHYTASAGAYYDLPLALSGKATLGVQYNWKSRLYFSEFNLPISSQSASGELNLTALYTTADRRWSFGLYGRNLNNAVVKSNVLVTSALLGSLALAQLQPGREIGLQLHFNY